MLEFDEHASAPTVNQNMFGVLEEDEKIQVASLPEMCSQDHIEDVILAMSAKVPDTASPSFDIVANGTQVSHEAEEVYMGKKRRISALGDENPFHHISKQLELLPKDFDLIEEIGRQASEIAELKLKVGKMQAGLIMTTEALKKASKKISDGRLSNQHFRVLLELLQRHRTKPDAGSMELDNMMPSHDEDNCKPGDGLNWIALQNQSTPHYRLLLELLQTVATMKANDQVRPDSEDPTFLKKGLSTDDEADWKENVIKAKKQRCLLELMNLIARHQEEVISSLETKVHENQDKEKHEQLLSIVHSSLLKDFHQRELDTVNEQLETVVKEYSACMTKLRECTDLIESLRARASLDCASQTDEINSENAVEVCLGSNSNDCTSLSKECIDDFRATSQQMAISDDKVNQENRAPKNLPLIMNVSNLLQKPAVDNFDEKKLEDHSVQISSFSPDQFVISFSGFRDGQPGYDLETKAKLMELLESMGATLSHDSEFDENITHIIMPPNSRTFKAFAACLTSKWLMTNIKWVFDSRAAGHWLKEDEYGFRYKSHPLHGKKFFLTNKFLEESKDGSKAFRVTNAKNLIDHLGGGKVVDSSKDADYCICSSEEFRADSELVMLKWTGLF